MTRYFQWIDNLKNSYIAEIVGSTAIHLKNAKNQLLVLV